MADLSELNDFLEDDGFDSPPMPSKKFPEGKAYHIPSPDAETGLHLAAIVELAFKQQNGVDLTEADMKRLRVKNKDESEFSSKVLSVEVFEEMLADGVRWEHLRRITQYAFLYFAVSKEAADLAVESGLFRGKHKAPTPLTT